MSEEPLDRRILREIRARLTESRAAKGEYERLQAALSALNEGPAETPVQARAPRRTTTSTRQRAPRGANREKALQVIGDRPGVHGHRTCRGDRYHEERGVQPDSHPHSATADRAGTTPRRQRRLPPRTRDRGFATRENGSRRRPLAAAGHVDAHAPEPQAGRTDNRSGRRGRTGYGRPPSIRRTRSRRLAGRLTNDALALYRPPPSRLPFRRSRIPCGQVLHAVRHGLGRH
jgi:hypothetical protein